MNNYTGNKKAQDVFKKIINHIPKFKVYAELFCGSGIVFKELYNSKDIFIVNDPNPDVVNHFSKEYDFENVVVCNDDIFDILQSLITVIYGKYTPHPDIQSKATLLDQLIASIKLKGTLAAKDIFIFFDPPYLFETRSNTSLYTHEFTNDQHIQLLQLVKLIPYNLMIIHPACELYDTALAGWFTYDLKIRYHRKTSIERLYMNYALPTELQTTKFLGNDCWERQRIKRKGDRLVNKINRLPELEKQYILTKLKTLQP